MDPSSKALVTKVAKQGAVLVVRYGPQAKILWDKGGKQATSAAAQRARTLNARRKAFAHALGLVEGSVLKIAPTGTSMYIVFAGDVPVAAYPPQRLPYAVLLEHADLTKRIPVSPKPTQSKLARSQPGRSRIRRTRRVTKPAQVGDSLIEEE